MLSELNSHGEWPIRCHTEVAPRGEICKNEMACGFGSDIKIPQPPFHAEAGASADFRAEPIGHRGHLDPLSSHSEEKIGPDAAGPWTNHQVCHPAQNAQVTTCAG
jgi:hypothetical protein